METHELGLGDGDDDDEDEDNKLLARACQLGFLLGLVTCF